MHRVGPWVPAAVWAAVLFFASSQATVRIASGPDKLAHVGAYLVLGLLLARAAVRVRWPVWVAILFGLLYGVTDEVHQSMVPGRTADLADWAADAVGVVVGTLLYLAYRRRPWSRNAGRAPAESTST